MIFKYFNAFKEWLVYIWQNKAVAGMDVDELTDLIFVNGFHFRTNRELCLADAFHFGIYLSIRKGDYSLQREVL